MTDCSTPTRTGRFTSLKSTPRPNGYGRRWSRRWWTADVTAAVELAERLLRQTETVEQFNALLKNSRCTDLYNGNFWRISDYVKAQSAIAPDGDGLGRGFVEQFMPSPPHPNTLQNALDSYYAERRKAAAKRRKAIAEEQQRQAEAERAEREAAARQAALIRHWRPWEQSTGPKTEAGVARTATGVRAYQIGFNPAFLIIHDYGNNLEFLSCEFPLFTCFSLVLYD